MSVILVVSVNMTHANPLRSNCSDNNSPDVEVSVQLQNAAGISTPNFCGEYQNTFTTWWYDTYWCPLSEQCDVYECMFTDGLTNVCTDDYECVAMANPVMIWNSSVATHPRVIVVASDRNETIEDRGFSVKYVDWLPPANPYRRVCTDVGGPLLQGSEIEMQLWGSAHPVLIDTCGDFPLYDLNYTLLNEYCDGTTQSCVGLGVFANGVWDIVGQPETEFSSAELCTYNQPIEVCANLTSEDWVYALNDTNDNYPHTRKLIINVTYMNATDETKLFWSTQNIVWLGIIVNLRFNDIPVPDTTLAPTTPNSTRCIAPTVNPTRYPTDFPTFKPTSQPSHQKHNTVDRALFISIPMIVFVVTVGIIIGVVVYKSKFT